MRVIQTFCSILVNSSQLGRGGRVGAVGWSNVSLSFLAPESKSGLHTCKIQIPQLNCFLNRIFLTLRRIRATARLSSGVRIHKRKQLHRLPFRQVIKTFQLKTYF